MYGQTQPTQAVVWNRRATDITTLTPGLLAHIALAALVASERHHSRKAREEIHGTPVLANPTGNHKLRFHFIQRPPKIRRQNGSDDRAAFVANDVGFFTAPDGENASAAVRIAEVRVGENRMFGCHAPESNAAAWRA